MRAPFTDAEYAAHLARILAQAERDSRILEWLAEFAGLILCAAAALFWWAAT